MLCAGLVLMAYPLLDIPQRNWFVGNLKTLPTAAPTGTIILYGVMEGHGMKESSRETGRPLHASERQARLWGPTQLPVWMVLSPRIKLSYRKFDRPLTPI